MKQSSRHDVALENVVNSDDLTFYERLRILTEF